MKIRMILAVLLCSAALVSAQSYIANLNSAQEGNPNNTSTATGIINATLSGSTFTFNGSFSGLVAPVNNGGFHIHGPAAIGANASVIFPLYPTMTLSSDQRSGTMAGSVTMNSQQIDWLNQNLLYFNIHSTTFTGGEIRGQILPVPEPSTWALMGFGTLGLLWRLRRKKA